MRKIEKAMKGLECCLQGAWELCKECPYHELYPNICIVERDQDALEVLKERVARVLTLEEMKSLSTANDDALFDSDMTFVWLEAAADGYINITRPTYSFNPEWGNEDDSFYVYYIGTDVGDRLRSCDYDKTWRCWTARPTDEQREKMPWT